jgi:Ca2+-binding RTX toxin-like protein
MMATTDGLKAYVRGTAGNDDARANYGDADGTIIDTGAGNDILRGGRFDDILVGRAGDDQMFGGAGADQFRFFGNQIEGASDTDKIRDLNFSEGDSLVFGNFGAGTFQDHAGENAFTNGTAAKITSWVGVVNAVDHSDLIGAHRLGLGNDTLVLSLANAQGQIENVQITGGWSAYVAAGGHEDAVHTATALHHDVLIA